MKIDILNCDKWVLDNNIPEVKSGALMNSRSSEPDPEGLVSYEIFGRPGTRERKQSYAFIDLVDKFVNPHVYYEFTRYQRNITNLVNGITEFFLDPETGLLVESSQKKPIPKGARHGLGTKFLYEIWNSINFEEPEHCAPATAFRLKFLRALKREEVFMTKLPVIPAFYRDVHTASEKVNEINTFYRKFLTNAATIKATQGMFELFGVSSSDRKIQDNLLELYNYFIKLVGGSKGFIHKNVMGKATDYSARAVISMSPYDSNTADDCEVDYEHSAMPLSTTLKCFAPFIKYGIKKIIERTLAGRKVIPVRDGKTGEVTRKELVTDFMDDFNSDNLDKLIELYDSSFDHRFDIFQIRCKDGTKVPLMHIFDEENEQDKRLTFIEEEENNLKEMNTGRISWHPATLTEIFYMAAYETCNDKCIYITRYPIEDQHNIYPSLFNIVPCVNTTHRFVKNIEYPRFPVIPKDLTNQEELTYLFTDSLRLFPTYLKALGGDFDGDQVSIQGIFTEEANKAARDYIDSNMNIMNVSGGTMREVSEVAQLGNYMLTYRFPQTA